MDADKHAREIFDAYEQDRACMVHIGRYNIGDHYEATCHASALTISKEHLPELRREGDVLRGTAFFPPGLVPKNYRDRVTETGVVPIGIEFLLDDVNCV